nr:HU family DNA-binding protein [uncultured Agathobaculum sp.]
MKKSEFIALTAEKAGLSKKDMEKAMDAVFETIGDVIAAGDKMQVSGFGTFETRKRAARTGHNPRTGEEIAIAAATIPAFKPGKALKDKVDAN